ncbi:MAG: hypothetical protein IKR85_00895 [Clostridia bacterium]|nr:hypothetical protein [Clostridia bacterium]
MFDFLYGESLKHAVHRVWILSDLQQSLPENTRRCLAAGISDFELLGRPAEQIWYLGDAVEGSEPERLVDMCELQEKAFAALDIPLCYATGNHDYDYSRSHRDKPAWIPFYDMVRDHPGWKTTADCEEFYFRTQIGKYPVYFLCDHIARDNSWSVTHSRVRWGEDVYPYTDTDAQRLRAEMLSETEPMMTCGHYGFSGCNRDHALMDRLLPLPATERIHFYGHSHIGDWVWGKKDTWRRICWVDWHDVPQIDVSSFENIRGEHCRSVLLHIYGDGGMGVFFRDHDRHRFTEAYFPARENEQEGWNDMRLKYGESK